MRLEKPLLLILALSLVLRIIPLFFYQPVWWDGAVYIGMAKFIYSLGALGLWEPVRPIILPLLLGWNPQIITARIVEMLFSLGSILLLYNIAAERFNKTTAIVSSLLLSFSQLFYFYTFRINNELIAVFFALLALYVFMRKAYFLSGLIFGISFLSKFPAALFFLAAFLYLALRPKENYAAVMRVSAGFLAAIAPYLVFNYIAYGNPFFSLMQANSVISKVVGCNYLSFHSWYYYIVLLFRDSFLYIFLVAAAFSYRKLVRKNLLVVLMFLLPLIYFSSMHCRVDRYMILFLPFAAMLSGFGLSVLTDLSGSKLRPKLRPWLYALIIIVSLSSSVIYLVMHTQEKSAVQEEYYSWIRGREAPGKIWVTNPVIALYAPRRVELLYYPVFNTELAQSMRKNILEDIGDTSYVFIDSCGGGIFCPPDDGTCEAEKAALIEELDQNLVLVFNKTEGGCFYRIWSSASLP